MQNPNTGELLPVPDDDLENALPDWKTYEVGQKVVFNGWQWEITEIFFVDGGRGELKLKPVKKANLLESLPATRHYEDEFRTALEAERNRK